MKSPDKGKQTDWFFLTLVIAVAAIVRLDFRARLFSWEKTGAATLQAYERLMPR